MSKFLNASGQIVLILLLVITVSLGIGLAVIQRSLTDISTASNVELSSRAFSAAEAGIERALNGNTSGVTVGETGNSSSATLTDSGLLPSANQALEYPPLSKEDTAQFWLADPNTLNDYYTQNTLDIYWGTQNIADPNDRPALSLTLIYFSGGKYQSKKYFFDPNSTRISTNGFKAPDNCSNVLTAITTSYGSNRSFYCTSKISNLPSGLKLLRARFLYNTTPQALVVKPTGSCNNGCSLPPQARLFTSVGIAGSTQRVLQLFKLDKTVPPFFDYAIFTAGDLTK
ncbi:MAG: pilus assembly PilX N-terminal domain-containing protein [Candidatus Daviesbacteria bacterium]|nr:MAG: pilus assembly PilX N-terminal domain-containing protein [Candidatus Daviesbacteria bacterium]